ncbi:hypothetical protein BDZ45DRAFT_706447 [Acephala macrosclerotiorum]|nr:hypothetical protein BDZ45DRAFT_706447 [Acephala macrosclerotiorum]
MNSKTFPISLSTRTTRISNGRRYHAFRVGSYYAPNDETGNDRLDMHHHLATLLLKGKLHIAPIGANPQQILNVGCGTGIWAIDMGDEYPSAQVRESNTHDLAGIWQFEVDDVEGEWTCNTFFDLIHTRFIFIKSSLKFVIASIVNWPKLVKQTFTHSKPGGWCKFKDWEFALHSGDNSLPADSQILKYHQTLYEALDRIRRDWKPGAHLKKMEQVLVVLINMWPKDKHYKEIGAWHHVVKSEGLEAVSLRLFTNVLGWTQEEGLAFLAKVRAELKDKSIHVQHNYNVVIDQKRGKDGVNS